MVVGLLGEIQNDQGRVKGAHGMLLSNLGAFMRLGSGDSEDLAFS